MIFLSRLITVNFKIIKVLDNQYKNIIFQLYQDLLKASI